MEYRIVQELLVWRRPRMRVLSVVIDVPEGVDVRLLAQQVIDELLRGDELIDVYIYADAEAVRWRGWIARAIASSDQPARIDTDNDPDLRRAVWREFR